MKETLLKEDLQLIKTLKTDKVNVASLKQLLTKINNNQNFKPDEKEYLKKVLVSNINNAFKLKG